MKHATFTLLAGLVVGALCWGAPLASRAQPAPTNRWMLDLSGLYADSSPAVAPEGTIYQANFDGKLLAVTPDGTVKWVYRVYSEIKSSPAVADDGTIYFGARDRKLYAVTPKGKLKWAFTTGAWVDSSPAVGTDGTIYFGSWDTNFYALNPDGSKRWVFPAGGSIVSSPAIAADGTVYFGSHDRKFYALRPDGRLLWSFTTGGQIISSPAIAADGTIYLTSTDGNFYALRPDGTERWRYHTSDASASSPVTDEYGNICVQAKECWFSFSATGAKRCWWCAGTSANNSAAIAANGVIYCSIPFRRFFALQPDCTELWHIDMEANVSASPAIGKDGTIFVNNGKYLYAIASTGAAAPPARSSWPMFRADARHTGRVQKGN
jgi:outer membrane protein assembly factor BamB